MVASCVKILESYMDFSQSASAVFRDLDGLGAMISRLAHEVCETGCFDVHHAGMEIIQRGPCF